MTGIHIVEIIVLHLPSGSLEEGSVIELRGAGELVGDWTVMPQDIQTGWAGSAMLFTLVHLYVSLAIIDIDQCNKRCVRAVKSD